MDDSQYTAEYDSPLGPLTIASDGAGEKITGLWIKGQKHYGSTLGAHVAEVDLPIFAEAAKWLDGYFKGERPRLSFQLAPIGTDFRQFLWGLLREIPYGEVVTYGEIAQELALRQGRTAQPDLRAVGNAVGHNPILIFIPCHRVVSANGSLTGYAGGIYNKVKLLQLENVDTDNFFIPDTGTAL